MGIGVDIIGLLTTLKKKGYLPSSPAIIEIGAQQLANSLLASPEALRVAQELFGVATPFTGEVKETSIVHGRLQHQHHAAPPARDFWKWLGFEYAAIDIDESEGSIALDLNYDAVPAEHVGKYDLVTNFGTTEHVANQLNAFKIMHELTAHGGIMVHNLPAQGMMNHGLFNYNPKFFWMLLRSNGYHVVFANYLSSADYYDLPENVTEHVATFDASIRSRVKDYKIADSSIVYILKKVYDSPFVPPIDIPTGTHTSHDALKERYWTVFNNKPFGKYQHFDPIADRLLRYVKQRLKG